MQIEVIKKPQKLTKSNSDWLQVYPHFETLNPDECLRITGLTQASINGLRQQAYREEVDARTFTRLEQGEFVLYLYKKARRDSKCLH